MPCEYFLLIRRQRRPCLLAIDDGLCLAGQHAGRACTSDSASADHVASLQIIFTYLLFTYLESEQSTKQTGRDRFSNFMRPLMAKSVPGPDTLITNNMIFDCMVSHTILLV